MRLGARPHIVAATNPGRRGHGWVKDLFVTPTDYGAHDHVIVNEMEGIDFAAATRRVGFVHATVLDNPHIDPRYVDHLMSLPEALRRQYLLG